MMMKKLIVLLLILGMASSAFSVPVVQDLVKTTAQRAANAPNSQDWFTVANWNGNVNVGTPGIPQNDTALLCNGATLYGSAATSYNSSGATDSIIIAGGAATVGQLRVGSNVPNTPTVTGTPAALAMNSGSLTIGNPNSPLHNSGFMSVGSDSAAVGSAGRNGLFYMNGGAVTALFGQGAITIGNGNSTGVANGCFGKMYMTGGTVDALTFRIGRYAGVTGEVYLSGGTITTNVFTMGFGTKLLDITGSGKFVIDSNVTATIATYIANGWLTGNGNDYDIRYDYNITTPLKTTIFVPEPATICLLSIGALSLLRRRK
jgi:hypothetical protein